MFVIEQKNSGKKKTGEKPNIEIEKTFRKKKKANKYSTISIVTTSLKGVKLSVLRIMIMKA